MMKRALSRLFDVAPCEIDAETPLTAFERVCGGLALLSPLLAILAVVALCGCAYKGGKIVDGTNLAIGMTIPGTEWSINALDYVGGVRVAGNDATHIVVSNEVIETNRYFGCVTTQRHTRMTADIMPIEMSATNEVERASVK